MFKTIVLALDGSEGSKRTLPMAAELARHDGAKIVLAHVEERMIGKGAGPVHADEDQVQAEIRKQARELSADGIETSIQMRTTTFGGPGQQIEEIAEEVGADLIVTGTRSYSAATGLILGSVTHRLVHIARRPVLVVPPAEA
jgi:nucleotide-binding universal stress UspA family protein